MPGASFGMRGTRSRQALSVAHGMVAMIRGERPAALRNPEIRNPEIRNPEIRNPEIRNPEIYVSH
jgi:hypothetical protein